MTMRVFGVVDDVIKSQKISHDDSRWNTEIDGFVHRMCAAILIFILNYSDRRNRCRCHSITRSHVPMMHPELAKREKAETPWMLMIGWRHEILHEFSVPDLECEKTMPKGIFAYHKMIRL